MKIRIKIIPEDGPNEVYEFDRLIEASDFLIKEYHAGSENASVEGAVDKRGFFNKIFKR